GLVAFQAPLVATQPLLDPHCRLIGTGIGVGGQRLRFEHDARIEMDHTFGSEAEALLADGHVTRVPAVEIFCGRLADARFDARAQRPADIDVLARTSKWHDRRPRTRSQKKEQPLLRNRSGAQTYL